MNILKEKNIFMVTRFLFIGWESGVMQGLVLAYPKYMGIPIFLPNQLIFTF